MTNKLFEKIKPTYVFNFFALTLLAIAMGMNLLYIKTQAEIVNINHQANIEYVRSLSENLSRDIKHILEKDFVKSLRENEIARDYVASDLKLFVTTKYKYIYLISKSESDKFIYLGDSQTQPYLQKMFNDYFEPKDKEDYEKVYQTKKPRYFKNIDDANSWATYLSPIIVNEKIEAVIVIKFSIEEQKIIVEALNSLKNLFTWILGFFKFIFIFMVWFSSIDKKREKQKKVVFKELQESNLNLQISTMELKTKSDELNELNRTLETRVQDGLQKNRAKDAQLIHQSRLAQMGETISMIAHQWRQPLNSISAESANLLLKTRLGSVNDEIIIQGSQNISKYSQHLSDTIDDFKDFFKPDKESALTNYNDVISSVCNIIDNSLEMKNISMIKELNCHEGFESYPNELKQVILNLIKNSEDALMDNKVKEPFIKILTYVNSENRCVLEVSDNAGGIDEKIIDKIFDPYFSTKSKKDGTGLGLYMSKMIIEEHCNGKIIVQNKEDGVVFRILLGENSCKI